MSSIFKVTGGEFLCGYIVDIAGHPKATKCYGWSHAEGENDEGERFVTVLEIPPVDSPVTAVRASIVADGKKRKAGK